MLDLDPAILAHENITLVHVQKRIIVSMNYVACETRLGNVCDTRL